MPLLTIARQSPEAVAQLTMTQILGLAGDGKLTDGSETSQELRTYLGQCELSRLASLAHQCLEPGANLGQALQDLVNELGARLGFQVEPGRYQGVKGANGMDGLWRGSDGRCLVVEVKTTDTYRINLDTISRYRDRYCDETDAPRKDVAILIVVGRQDTGDLEAQVRGSRHAWDVRLISVDALLKLCHVRQGTDENTQRRMEAILRPLEFTRLDQLIDVVFTAVEDVLQGDAEIDVSAEPAASGDAEPVAGRKHLRSRREDLEAARSDLVAAINRHMSLSVTQHSRALFQNHNGSERLVCGISKVYPDGGLWFVFHPRWQAFLSGADRAFVALAVVGETYGFVIPVSVVVDLLPRLFRTGDPDHPTYWHLPIGSPQAAPVLRLRDGEQLDLAPYRVTWPLSAE